MNVSTFQIPSMNQALPPGQQADSVHDYCARTIGEPTSVVKSITTANGATSTNLFQITGVVRIKKIYAQITSTIAFPVTAASFNLYDGSTTTQLTKNDGVLTNAGAATVFSKNAANTVTFVKLDTAVGGMAEGTTGLNFYECEVCQTLSTSTYIRFTHTSTGVNTLPITFYVEYIPIGSGTLVAV